MATRFFKKEMVSNPVTANGVRLHFEEVGDNEGILSTDNPTILAACEHFISRRIGGVSEISVEDFEALKKKETVIRQFASGGRSRREPMPHRSQDFQLIKEMKVAAVAAGADTQENIASAEAKVQSPAPAVVPPRIKRVNRS